ncbi:hypothetical protein COV13_01725 [Candidatus Woesearchaeota archaeon CG10_big_fil_rev_8_21_14_0_10_32_9]|nr:MAG: hypothetical protein COV13_01725 [Candidatus Woesearchaeota archaeon CG10_big_fil_rev_8_21_14_0_10_32_9]
MLLKKTKTGTQRICSKIVERRTVASMGKGLMFHKKIKDEAHIFYLRIIRREAITMFFVFFPLDVLFLDEHKRIVEIKENLKPFANYLPKNKASYVVELEKGTVAAKKLEVNDELIFD